MGAEASGAGNNPCTIDIFRGSGGLALGIGTALHAIAVLPVTLHFRFPTSSTISICLNSNTRGVILLMGRWWLWIAIL
jgi:hypothetical protein